MPTRRKARVRWVAAALALATVLLTVSAWVVWNRPAFSEEELEAASETLAAGRSAVAATTCHREAVGGPPVERAETHLETLIAPGGPFDACMHAASDDRVIDALQGTVTLPDGTRRTWGYDVPAGEPTFTIERDPHSRRAPQRSHFSTSI